MAANGNFSVFVVRCPLLHRSRRATVPRFLALRARVTGPAPAWPLPELTAAPACRLARSRLRCAHVQAPDAVVTCPGPGGPVTLSSAT